MYLIPMDMSSLLNNSTLEASTTTDQHLMAIEGEKTDVGGVAKGPVRWTTASQTALLFSPWKITPS